MQDINKTHVWLCLTIKHQIIIQCVDSPITHTSQQQALREKLTGVALKIQAQSFFLSLSRPVFSFISIWPSLAPLSRPFFFFSFNQKHLWEAQQWEARAMCSRNHWFKGKLATTSPAKSTLWFELFLRLQINEREFQRDAVMAQLAEDSPP